MASSSRGNSDSHLRLTDEQAVVFPAGAEPSDESPTIISKGAPPAAPEGSQTALNADHLAGSLRGRRLAHFELIEPIGVGGMAAVLRARDTQLDRDVALKILPPEMALDTENVRRFHQEARAAARLDHENIARVFYCGEDQKLHFIAFEFVEGDNLRTILEKKGRLTVGEAVRYTLQVAAGLDHAAARGVVHRDVKPSNIIITPTGRAKLVDMGLARRMERQADRELTQSGVTLGTFDYISPEQALEPREADVRSDIYSLGCTLYHLLTGQPPVPEGTPAKKLHHHQHVAPLDPRVLNPNVPDEVALILGRMMAKDPRHRYQRPAQLVQHLLQVAPKVGVASDVPEGVLFVDAPLPAEPRARPLLLIAIAGAALVAVLVLLSLAPTPPSPPPPGPMLPPDTTPPIAHTDRKPPVEVPVKGTEPPRTATAPVVSAAGLRAALEAPGDESKKVHIRLAGTINLGAGLRWQRSGRTLVLESADAAKPATLRFASAAKVGAALAGLSLEDGAVTLRGLRFELEADTTPEQAVATLTVRGAGKVRIEQCTFAQKGVPPARLARLPLASILIESPETGAPRADVTLNGCLFQGEHSSEKAERQDWKGVPGGQAAVAIAGAAHVEAVDCAFRAHAAFFHLRGRCRPETTSLKVEHCAGFVVDGPAFRFDEGASCDLKVEKSLFSRPENLTLPDGPQPYLLHRADDTVSLPYRGRGNGYHYLLGFLTVAGGPGPLKDNLIWARLEDFQTRLAPTGGKEEDALVLREPVPSPWQASQPLREPNAARAFRLRYELFGKDGPKYGPRRCVWGESQPGPAPPPPVVAGGTYKVVDPDAPSGAPNVFPNLAAALASAAVKDTILIKPGLARREVEVSPVVLKPGSEITLRPYAKDRPPTLVLDRKVGERDAALFRVLDGSLRLEGLHLVLEPAVAGFTAQSVVHLGENGRCAFVGCAVTLKPARGVPLRVVTFLDPKDLMKMETQTPVPPRVELRGCFVRGEGDLINLRVSRPLGVAVENCLVALSGSLLAVQGGAKEAAAESGVRLELRQVSAFLTEPLLVLRARKGSKGLARTIADPVRDCLFVALADRPLLALEAPEGPAEESAGKHLDWKGQHNCYVNFRQLFEQQRPEGGLGMSGLADTRWKELYPEPESVYGSDAKVNLPVLMSEEAARKLWLARPADFRPEGTEAPFPFGAHVEVDALLPPPPPGTGE